MKRIISVISILLVLGTILSLAACKEDKPAIEPAHTTEAQEKSTLAETVKIIEIPADKASCIEMFNAALDYVELYCYNYTKKVKCDVSNLSMGSLSSASNADAAFRSIFGKQDHTTVFDYNTSKELFAENFPQSGFTASEVTDAVAEQKDSDIILTLSFPDESNPNSGSLLARLTNTYLDTENVGNALTQFNSSASSVTVYASDITAIATINAQDSRLKKFEIKYTQRYALSGVNLVKLEGSSVSAISNTIVAYTEIG